DVSGLIVSNFKASVSGAVNGDITGTGSYFKQEQGGLLISMVGMNGPSNASISIILPAGTRIGTYTPTSYTEAYDTDANKINDVGASFSISNATGGVDDYATITEGTLTLQAVDPMTGSIHFKATLNGNAVDVQATFYQLAPV